MEIDQWNAPSSKKFKPLDLDEIEVDPADFWTNRWLSSSPRSTADELVSNLSHALTSKSGRRFEFRADRDEVVVVHGVVAHERDREAEARVAEGLAVPHLVVRHEIHVVERGRVVDRVLERERAREHGRVRDLGRKSGGSLSLHLCELSDRTTSQENGVHPSRDLDER